MKTLIAALVLSLGLSACAGLASSSSGSTSSATDTARMQPDYGARDAAREYPYDAAY